jgi:ribitol-5-phosphate 2-dehydrogenase (NADP+)
MTATAAGSTTADAGSPGLATVYRLTGPFRIEPVVEPLPRLGPGMVLLGLLRAGICGSDLKLYSGTRERSALARKLPIALLHEAVAAVLAVGPGTPFTVGDHVVPSPNIPCSIANPAAHPVPEAACYACRPGGPGPNYCLDGHFLSSDVDGMARTAFAHPAACTVPIRDRVPDELAVLTEPMATILAGLDRALTGAATPPDGRFLVLGNGAIGILTAITLRVALGVPPERILVTGHHWDVRAGAVERIATPVADEAALLAAHGGRIDVAFECVGGEATPDTLALAVEALRPGATGVLFGPSEGAALFDTRSMIAKGLSFMGCNRATPDHFERALDLCADPGRWPVLEHALCPKEFAVHDARELEAALYYAWTKTDPGRAVTIW